MINVASTVFKYHLHTAKSQAFSIRMLFSNKSALWRRSNSRRLAGRNCRWVRWIINAGGCRCRCAGQWRTTNGAARWQRRRVSAAWRAVDEVWSQGGWSEGQRGRQRVCGLVGRLCCCVSARLVFSYAHRRVDLLQYHEHRVLRLPATSVTPPPQNAMVWHGMVNVDLYSAIITKSRMRWTR